MKAIDTPNAAGAAAQAANIAAAGYSAVFLYYFVHSAFKSLLDADVAKALSAAGLTVGSVFENGSPTVIDYFTVEQANTDAHAAFALAQAAGQPTGSAVYFTTDCDIDDDQVPTIVAYYTEVHRVFGVLAGDGDKYLVGAYGPGVIFQPLIDAGVIHFTWLSESHGFNGSPEWVGKADVVQLTSTFGFGLDIDTNTLNTGNFGGWQAVAPAA